MHTPWGVSSHHTLITDGVWFVETARHGGILVSRLVAHTLLSPAAIARGKSRGRWLAYEEDCDWSLFAYEQPLLYAAACAEPGSPPRPAEEIQQAAHECLLLWHPDYLVGVEKGVE